MQMMDLAERARQANKVGWDSQTGSVWYLYEVHIWWCLVV